MTTPSDPLADLLRGALDEEERPHDDAMIARAIEAATQRTSKREATPSYVENLRNLRRPGRARVWRFALPIAAAFVVSMAMAMSGVFRMSNTPAPAASPPPAPLKKSHAGPAGEPRVVPETAPSFIPEATPSFSVDDLPSAPSAAHKSASPLSPSTPSPGLEKIAHGETAPELFREANTARRAGEVTKALAVYRALIQRFPKAPESLASRVSLGRLLLDRQGDPGGALEQFDAYLVASSGDHTLDEEARVGKALALQRLGRSAEEQRAWEELMRTHPTSLHAGHARDRLRVLRGGEASPP